jgi:hypothetical protein
MQRTGWQRRCSCTLCVQVAAVRALGLAWLLVLCCGAQEADQAAGSAAHGSSVQHHSAVDSTAGLWQRCPSYKKLPGSLQLALQGLVASGADGQAWSSTLQEQAAQQHVPASAVQALMLTAATGQVTSSRRLLARSNGTSTWNVSAVAAPSGSRDAVAAGLPALQHYTPEPGHEGRRNVQLPQSPAYPFSMVGQLDNGCSGFLVGECGQLPCLSCAAHMMCLWHL